MPDINALINEYMALTGRPMATLSVEEYLSIRKYADGMRIYNDVPKTASNEAKASYSMQQAQDKADTAREIKPEVPAGNHEKNPSQTKNKPDGKVLEPHEKELKEKNAPASSAFMLMRSIQS